MKTLPRWTWPTMFVLAFAAGAVNVVAMIGLSRQALSHVTGSVSKAAASLAEGDWWSAIGFFAAVGAFVGGATLCGVLVGSTPRRIGRGQVAALGIEALLLAASARWLPLRGISGICAASAACGLQNGVVSLFGGYLFRTTHLTGMATDFGLAIGHRVRRLPVDGQRLRASLAVGAGFLLGGVVGAMLFHAAGFAAMWLPCLLVASLAVGAWWVSPLAV